MNDCCFHVFQNTKTSVYSEGVILQRPLALVIILNTRPSHVTLSIFIRSIRVSHLYEPRRFFSRREDDPVYLSKNMMRSTV